MKEVATKHTHIFVLCLSLVCLIIFFIFLPKVFSDHYVFKENTVSTRLATTTVQEAVFAPSYVATPDSVKGIYMTSWVAGTPKLREALVKLTQETELNSIVIDIKDYSGKIIFPVTTPELKAYGSEEVRAKDLRDFIESLHKKGIYVIGRAAVFQDAYFVTFRPDLAVKNKTGTTTWKDHKGISWIDAGAKEYWDYIILITKEARKIGFDEINFDYIRFPSDGDMKDISYPVSSTTPKSVVLQNFFKYLHDNLKNPDVTVGESTGASSLKISADLFGMVTTAQDDMGIGQVLEKALPYFDYIDPMVYPSHYPPTFEGFKEPEAHPYEVVFAAMKSAVDRADAFEQMASTTNPIIEPGIHYRARLRPWLQDFGLRQTYGPDEVKAQIKATNDVHLSSWILWSASNKYTRGALVP